MPSVGLHDPMHHGKAQPSTLPGGFGGEEGLEDPRDDLRCDTRAIVLHMDDGMLGGAFGANA